MQKYTLHKNMQINRINSSVSHEQQFISVFSIFKVQHSAKFKEDKFLRVFYKKNLFDELKAREYQLGRKRA